MQSSYSTQVPIPDDNGQTSVSGTVSFTSTAPITDVTVNLDITHTYDANLDITLTSPEGTTIDLTKDNGGTGNNYTNTVFDDDAANAITDGTAPFTGTYRPEGSLSDFDGEDPSGGVWTLTVVDDDGGQAGTLNSFSVEVCAATDPCTDPAGTDTDSDGINDVCDLDDDNDGILDSDEICGIAYNPSPAVDATNAFNWNRPGVRLFGNTGTNGYGFRNSGWEAAVFDLGQTIDITAIETPTLNSGSDFEATFTQGTVTLTRSDNAINFSTATSTGQPSGDWTRVSGDGVDAFDNTGLKVNPVNGLMTFEISIDFTAGSNINYFGFDINDIIDTNPGGNLIYELYVDGVLVWRVASPPIGDDATDVVDYYDGNSNVLVSPTIGQDYETFIGIIKESAISNITFMAEAIVDTSTDPMSIDNFVFASPVTPCDTDSDGIADVFDTDSDNDNCPDAIEGAGSFTDTDIDTNDMLTGGVDANGIPTVATASGQAIGDSQDAGTQSADCVAVSSCPSGYVEVSSTISGNADVVTSQSGVNSPSSATGVPDGNAAELYDTNDEIVLDLTDVLDPGTDYVIRWRRATNTNDDPSLTVEESLDGTNWTTATGSPFTFSSTSYFNETIAASTSTRYLRFTSNNAYNTDLDGVSYTVSASTCELDTDSDGIDNVNDLDNDNDGILDENEKKCINSATFDINTPSFEEDTDLTSGLTATLNGLLEGTLNVTASVPASASWGNGVQIKTDSSVVGKYIYVQPENTSMTPNTGTGPNTGPNTGTDYATYTIDILEEVTEFSFTSAGLNYSDTYEIRAYNDGVQIPLTIAANVSGFVPATGWTTSDLGDGGIKLFSSSTSGGTAVNDNLFTTTISQTVTRIEIRSYKNNSSSSTVTTGITSFAYCYHTDTDGDGIEDRYDTDSDNDGCPDAVEGAGTFTGADVNATTLSLVSDVNASGVPTIAGSPQPTTADVTSAVAVTIDTAPGNQSVLSGASASFTVAASADEATSYNSGTPIYGTPNNANAGINYQWYLGDPDSGETALSNSGVYSGTATASLSISTTTGSMDGNVYYVVVTHDDNVCEREVRSASLNVNIPPNSGSNTQPSQINPGGTTSVTVPATAFSGTDADGTVTSIRITTFPSNATSITINGTTYTSLPGGGITVPTNASGQPTQTISIDPADGSITVGITYAVIDNAGAEDPTPGLVSLPLLPLAKLTIIKTAVGGGAPFGFTATGVTPATFILNPTSTPSVQRIFEDIVPGTDITITESDNTTSLSLFDLVNVQCMTTESTSFTSTLTNNGTTAGALSITNIAPGEDMTCTFTNVKNPELVLTKNADVDAEFPFTITTSEDRTTIEDDAPELTTSSGTATINTAVNGFKQNGPTSTTVVFTEADPLGLGYALTDISCTLSDEDAATPLALTIDEAARTATLDNVAPGDIISCTYTNEKVSFDYGDLPVAYAAYDDAGHSTLDTSIYLGSSAPDSEDSAQRSDDADGDDATGVANEEDGISFSGPMAVGFDANLTVTASNGCDTETCYISIWIDFNDNGTFEASEKITTPTGTVGAGDTNITYSVPTGTDVNSPLFMMARLTTDADIGPTGYASDGEVETFKIEDPANLPVTISYVYPEFYGKTLEVDFGTATEVGNIGFNIYAIKGKKWTRLNEELIPGALDSFEPQEYHTQLDIPKGVKFKKIGIAGVDVKGKEDKHGPFKLGQQTGEKTVAKPVNWKKVRNQVKEKRTAKKAKRKAKRAAKRETRKLFKEDLVTFNVSQKGVYRVTHDDLLAQGINLKGFKASKIAVSLKGEGVARHIEELRGGKWTKESALEFLGEAPNATDALYVKANHYRLSLDKALVIESDMIEPLTTKEVVIDHNKKYGQTLALDDPFYERYFYTTSEGETAQHTVTFDMPFTLQSGTSHLSVLTEVRGKGSHTMGITLNGTEIARAKAQDRMTWKIETDVDNGLLEESANTLTVTLYGDSDGVIDFIIYDKLIIRYDDGEAKARLIPQIELGDKVAKKDIRGKKRNDYLIITHPLFMNETLDEYVQQREGEGWNIKVVNVEDIYAAYTDGMVIPEAIKIYINEQIDRGVTHIQLIGAASYDAHDYLGTGSVSLIPSIYTLTNEYINYTPSDASYVMGEDKLPQAAIGRWPVRALVKVGFNHSLE